MRPRLLINAKWRTQPRISGVQRYARGLAQAIDASDLDHAYAQPEHSGRMRGTLWEQRTLPKLARAYDALLCPANMAPARLDDRTRLLTVIHCLRFRFHPQSYSPAFVRWYERMIPRIIDRADTVFTVSDAQRLEIGSVYPHARGKTEVLSPGLGAAFRPGLTRDPDAPRGRYLIALTSAAPAKNAATLIRAHASCSKAPTLLLVGMTQREADIINPSPNSARVHALGHLNDPSRIASLLCHAEALLSPSRYESFGLPCLEAMGCATPVVASDLAAHREVCAEAAFYADPSDTDAWIDAMNRVSEDADLRARMSRLGLQRASSFTWDRAIGTLRRTLGHDTADAAR